MLRSCDYPEYFSCCPAGSLLPGGFRFPGLLEPSRHRVTQLLIEPAASPSPVEQGFGEAIDELRPRIALTTLRG